MKIYKKLIKPILFLMKPETAHNFTLFAQSMMSKLKVKNLLKPIFKYKDPKLETEIFGLKFDNPVGLPAGCDKKGTGVDVWEVFGFGWVTVGSITFQPQPGNPKPRLFRLIPDQSMQVHLGLNSIGAEKMKKVLKKKKVKIPWGISIARTTDIPDEAVVEDYLNSFQTLYHLPDYFEINISCPNIPDTEYFKRGDFLKRLLEGFQKLNTEKKPLLLKIGPDLTDGEIDWIVKNVKEYKIDGIIVSNLLKDLSKISPESELNPKGGVSGKLLQPFANDTLKKVYQKTGGKIPLIGLGGIFTGQDAYEKIRLGASLVQMYTGMVIEGPGAIKRVKKELAELLERDGFKSFRDAVGVDVR
jgi:dihydroorotate dehydrogenase